MSATKIVLSGLTLAAVAGTASVQETEEVVLPEMPKPQKEHEWLQQLVGEWTVECEMYISADSPPMEVQSVERVRSIGGFWVVAETTGTVMKDPFTGVLTLGYDPQRQKYVGTWIGSVSSALWTYEGTLDETGKVLTLETEGECPAAPGKLMPFKEVIEFKDKDHRIFTSTYLDDDGKWTTAMVGHYRRKQ